MKKEQQPVNTCILPLGDGYRLSLETIDACAPLKKKQDKLFWPASRLISFNNDAFKLHLSWAKQTWILGLSISKNYLAVNCSCNGTEEGKLCPHAAWMLRRWALYHSNLFEMFAPGGQFQLAKTHKNYFTTKWIRNGLEIKKRNLTGTLFGFEDRMDLAPLKKALALTRDTCRQPIGTEWTLCYLLCFSPRKKMLPVIMPCLGRRTKNGASIKAFDRFLTGIGKEHEPSLTPNHRELNRLCLELFKTAEKLPGSLIDEDTVLEDKSLVQWFTYWHQALPLLQQQDFVFYYRLYHKKYLRSKPELRRAVRIQSLYVLPPIEFILLRKDAFYQFSCTAKNPVSCRPLKNAFAGLPFFITTDNAIYLLASLREAALLEWIKKEGPVITVFNEYYPQFEKEVLNEIKKYYRIQTLRAK